MSIVVVPYTADRAQAWDAFIGESRNGTFFHTRTFLSYHPDDRFADASLFFQDNGRILAVLPAAIVEKEGKKTLVSHPGASYGGLVLSKKCGMQQTGEIVDLLTAFAKEKGCSGVTFLRLTLPNLRRWLSDDQEYWLYQKGWKPMRFELSTSYDLRTLTPETVMESFDPTTRNKIRQAEKENLTLAFSDDFDAFWNLLNKTLDERHGAKPTHSVEEIKKLRSLTGQDVRLLAAFDGTAMIAGLVVITVHEKALYILYTAQDYSRPKLRAIPLLLRELFIAALTEKRAVLDFGISTEDGGIKVNESLFLFKESFGGQNVRRETWEVVL
jgi:Acetyltransferase (GNAT) domain